MKGILSLILLVVSITSQASPRSFLSIQAVEISTAKEASLSYWKVCNSNDLGLVIRQSGRKSYVGVLINNLGVQCLQAPIKVTIPLAKIFKKERFSTLVSLNPRHEPFKLKLLPSENALLHKDRLVVNYSHQCEQIVGTVIKTGLGILESAPLSAARKGSRCIDSRSGWTSINGLNIENIQTVRPMKKSRQSYRIKLKPIKAESIKNLVNGSKSFRYLRACSEAPIGLVRYKGRFAMAVARYSDELCSSIHPKMFWTQIKTNRFTKQLSPKTLWARPPKSLELELFSASNISFHEGTLQLKSAVGCGSHRGLVILEQNDRTLVGTLRANAYKPCKRAPSRVSLKIAGFSETPQKLEPLRLYQ